MTQEHSDIPHVYLKYSLQDFDQCEHAKAWLDAPDSWCYYITGGLGTGKSCLAAAMLIDYRRTHTEEAVTEGYRIIHLRGRFIPPYTFADVVRTLDQKRLTYEKWRDNRGPLVLDDVGSVRDTPHVSERLLHLLQHRYDHRHKLIVTTNMSVADFATHVDARAASRLQEGAMVHMGNVDRRRKQR